MTGTKKNLQLNSTPLKWNTKSRSLATQINLKEMDVPEHKYPHSIIALIAIVLNMQLNALIWYFSLEWEKKVGFIIGRR